MVHRNLVKLEKAAVSRNHNRVRTTFLSCFSTSSILYVSLNIATEISSASVPLPDPTLFRVGVTLTLLNPLVLPAEGVRLEVCG